MDTIAREFEKLAHEWMPRLLTQIDRDPSSSTFGCADRNWWHYKIRDFPSIILQQAGYAVFLASELPEWSDQREGLRALACASAEFWSRHIQRTGSFDEYYPWEQGYPPLAFSTLAVMKLVAEGLVPPDRIKPAAATAARLLQKRFEAQAANQQVAGMAALLTLRRQFPDLVAPDEVERVSIRTLGLQHSEGWYPEYGGPDLGYLSVTIDCLWDAYDATGDERYVASGQRALLYLETMTSLTGKSIGMHNARNTDYLVPYGISRFLSCADPGVRATAGGLMHRLFGTLDDHRHFLRATDDRYACHYIGWSVIRAGLVLRQRGLMRDEGASMAEKNRDGRWFAGSGHVLRPDALISLKKGGIFTLVSGRGSSISDFGWAFDWKGIRYVSHWWSDEWESTALEDGWKVSGDMVPCREVVSSPVKHALLRVASKFVGSRLIAYLKRRMIFRKHRSSFRFERAIRFGPAQVLVEDSISGVPAGVEPSRAPRASRRHVASADSYHPEDFPDDGQAWRRTETKRPDGSNWIIRTNYGLGDARSLAQKENA